MLMSARRACAHLASYSLIIIITIIIIIMINYPYMGKNNFNVLFLQ